MCRDVRLETAVQSLAIFRDYIVLSDGGNISVYRLAAG